MCKWDNVQISQYKNTMIGKNILILVLVFFYLPLTAQKKDSLQSNIRVSVVDSESEELLPLVFIEVYADEKLYYVTMADFDGNIHISPDNNFVKFDSLKLVITYPKYFKDTIYIHPKSEKTFSIKLIKNPSDKMTIQEFDQYRERFFECGTDQMNLPK